MNNQDIIDALMGRYTPQSERRITRDLEAALQQQDTLLFISNGRRDINRKIAKAKAELAPHTVFTTKAVAEKTNALQVPLQLTIAPLDVANANKQGIPTSEANNVIESAMHSPITASFTNGVLGGHSGVVPLGPITNVRNENNVIVADGYLWRNQAPDLVEYIQAQGVVYSSWEVWYEGSYDHNGTQWLTGVLFDNLTLVKNPSYGTLTPVRLA